MANIFTKKSARTFGVLGLFISMAVLGVSLAGTFLLQDQWIILTLAIATVSLQLIFNDLYWRVQKKATERGQVLLHCQLNSKALYVLRSPLLSVQSQVTNGMLVLIWSALLGGGIWLSMRHGVQNGYWMIIWLSACVLSAAWIIWVLVGRRCLNDDEIIISENACLARGRLDRWDLPGCHLLDVEFRSTSEFGGCALILRIWQDGPHQQKLIERYLPLPRRFMTQAQETCLCLEKQIWFRPEPTPDENGDPAGEAAAKKPDKAARTRNKQQRLEPVTRPVRISQLGDIILLTFSVLLGAFSQWIITRPQYTNPNTAASFATWNLPLIATLFGVIAVVDLILNWHRNRSFRESLDGESLLLFRMPSLWLECHLPEALNAARRELFNDGLLLTLGTFFTALAFALRRPYMFDYFVHYEIALLIVALILPFLVFIVYRDWALRRRLGLVHLTSDGLWLYDRFHEWGRKQGRLLSCSLVTPPSGSLETSRLLLHYQRRNEEPLLLEVPLDEAMTRQVQRMIDDRSLKPS